jgi:hypothetical protein
MSQWSASFLSAIDDDQLYPKFRLIVGNALVMDDKPGFGSGARPIRVITSQPEELAEGLPTDNLRQRDGFVSISIGSHSVVPRTLETQRASCTVTLTNEAAGYLLDCHKGAFSRVDCSINGSDWNTVFLGTFENLTWSGGATCSVSMIDVLNILTSKSYQTQAAGVDMAGPVRGFWFAGVGDTNGSVYSIVTSGGSLENIVFPAGTGHEAAKPLNEYSWGKTYKMHNAWTPVAADQIYTDTAYGGDGTMFVRVKGTAMPAGHTHCTFQYSQILQTTGTTGVTAISNPMAVSTLGFKPFVEGTTVMGATAEVTQLCHIFGDPVAELVNTFYQTGYHPNMVPGIFGSVATAGASPYLDWPDIKAKQRSWRGVWDHYTLSFSISQNCPLRHVVKNQTSNALSYLGKVFAGFGVFPIYRQGGYSVGLMIGGPDGDMEVPEWTIQQERVISAKWTMVDSNIKGVYRGIEENQTEEDRQPPNLSGDGGWFKASTPIIQQLKVDTSTYAVGENPAQCFYRFFRSAIFNAFYVGRGGSRLTVVLAGLSYARLALGDYVTVEWDSLQARDYSNPTDDLGHYMRGPYYPDWNEEGEGDSFEATPGEWKSPISKPNVMGHLNSDYQKYRVVGSQVDWMAGQVTLELYLPGGRNHPPPPQD